MKHIPYGLRLIIVILAFPTLPLFWVILQKFGWIPEVTNGWIHLLWVCFSLYLWARLSRRLLVTLPYYCNSCGKPEAMIVPEEDTRQTKMFYVCNSCGYRESSGVA